MIQVLSDTFATITTQQLHGLIITGGGRHFSSGANVTELFTMSAEQIARAGALFAHIAALPIPVVAAISGACLGAGLELALACSQRIATPRAVFALPEVEYGLMPGCGGTLRLPRCIGKSAAAELILSGRTFDAREALRLGLIDSICQKKKHLLQHCIALLHPIK
jgi:enoyl-CoA hydratase/carnithine racemase